MSSTAKAVPGLARAWVRQAAWLAAGGGLLAVALAVGAAERPSWREVKDGAFHRILEPRDVQADMLRFDLARYRVRVLVAGKATPLTAEQAVQQESATLAVNGGFFDPQWRPLGLRVDAGQVVVPLRAKVDWGVLVIENAHAKIVHSRDYQANPLGIEAALQVGPRLLVDGKPTKLKPQIAYRSAVAVNKEGTHLTIIVSHAPVDANALASALARLGEFDTALLLDGGPSSQLFAQIGDLALDRKGGYAVPDLLVVSPRGG